MVSRGVAPSPQDVIITHSRPSITRDIVPLGSAISWTWLSHGTLLTGVAVSSTDMTHHNDLVTYPVSSTRDEPTSIVPTQNIRYPARAPTEKAFVRQKRGVGRGAGKSKVRLRHGGSVVTSAKSSCSSNREKHYNSIDTDCSTPNPGRIV